MDTTCHCFAPRRTALAAALLGAFAAGGTRADELGDLKAQLDTLQKKVTALEAAASEPKPATVTAGPTPGSFRLPGASTSVTIGGYVKLDAIFSDRSAGAGNVADQQLSPGSIPVGPDAGANERNQLKVHARQSRIFFRTATPTAWGELTTYQEYDLFGAAGTENVTNSNGLRARHLYGSLGHLLAGQTWTTLSEPAAYPETLDFGGAAGVIFARQAQLRWTQPFAGGEWSVAVENPETVVAASTGASLAADDDRLPDLAANAKFQTRFGKYTIAAGVRQLRLDSASAPASVAHKFGGTVGVNAVVPFGADDLRASAYVGNAIGRYANGFFNDAFVAADGHLSLARQWVAFAAYRHFWAPGLRSTLALSQAQSANAEGTGGTVNRSARSAHLNLIWSPVPQTNFGLELIAARRETQDGQSGSLHRLQASAQYLF
ncbi:DcaP family trimeric outer membrane transporter [Ramlibacter sp. AN1133]|uniref:DcaP family trimeric outer membrane transporter n=1 Tax=Ramlibacter sp. AN1133 TaxID=3133429 RepID=UPI0030BBABA7